MYKRTYKEDFEWSSKKIQPIAEKLVYSKVWPDCEIIPLDKHEDILKLTLDIGGVDKLIKHRDGTLDFLAQRFRRPDCYFDDFTIRAIRPSGKLTELNKILVGIEQGRLLAAFYAYGHVNLEENNFWRFRIVRLRKFASMLLQGQILFGEFHWNEDGSSGFYVWPFKLIKNKDLIFREFEQFENECLELEEAEHRQKIRSNKIIEDLLRTKEKPPDSQLKLF